MTPATRAFLRAATDGDANLVRGLLAQGTNVDSTNQAGQTALMLAAGFKRRAVVQVLIAAGANVEIQDDLGLTVSDWAKNDPELIELFIQDEPKTDTVQPTPTPPRVEEDYVKSLPASVPIVQRPNEEPKLKGLAGAILRDHKPRLEERVQPTGRAQTQSSLVAHPEAEAATVTPPESEPPVRMDSESEPSAPVLQDVSTPILSSPDELKVLRPPALIEDETLDRPRQELTEETAAPRPSTASRSRIFDLSGPTEARPLSKVEVSVPEAKSQSRTLVWLLLLVLLSAVGIGAYFVTKRLLTGQPTTTTEVVTPKPEATPIVTSTKQPPVIGGELVGAELYLPDAAYPADAQGRNGTVRVGVQVSKKGVVLSAKALDGDAVFRDAAEKTAKGSAFSPDKLPNRVRTEGTITYTFAPVQSTINKAPAHGVTAVAGGPLSGAERDLIEPEYPSRAKDSGVGGEFTVVVRVNRAGHVMSWRTLNGDSRLRDAVVKAARRSTFSPDKLPGSGEVVGTITYTFN